MELDHIFIFTQAPDQVADSLQKFGLNEGTPNIHPGQGTSCKRFFFHNAYLELVWVSDEEEIKSPAIAETKLLERSQSDITGYCPFGLCFRVKNRMDEGITLIFDDAWRYESVYLPKGEFANIASNNDFATEPMLFEMPFFTVAPKDYPLKKMQPYSHEKGFEEITKVILTLPTPMEGLSGAMKKVLASGIVEIVTGEKYAVILEFDHCKEGEMKNFTPLIPLTFRW